MSRYAEGLSEHHHSPYTTPVDHLATDAGNGLLLLARVLIGGVFLLTGAMKLIDISQFAGYLAMTGLPAPQVMALAAAIVEFVCGLAIVLGLQLRVATLVLVVFTIVATLMAHRFWTYPAAEWENQFNHFIKNVMVIGGLIALFVARGGRYSLDRLFHRPY
jgi:putative oxidoreductase